MGSGEFTVSTPIRYPSLSRSLDLAIIALDEAPQGIDAAALRLSKRFLEHANRVPVLYAPRRAR